MKMLIEQIDFPRTGKKVAALAERIGMFAGILKNPAVDVVGQLVSSLADNLLEQVDFRSSSKLDLNGSGLRVALDVVNGAVVLTIGTSESVDAVQTKLLRGISLGKFLSDNADTFLKQHVPSDEYASIKDAFDPL